MILARECYRIEEYDTNGKPVVVTEALLPLENKNTRSVPNKFYVRHPNTISYERAGLSGVLYAQSIK